MSSCVPVSVAVRPASPAASASGLALRVLERVLFWVTMARTRRDLAALDDRGLRDIGLDRATAIDEASKPFWHSV